MKMVLILFLTLMSFGTRAEERATHSRPSSMYTKNQLTFYLNTTFRDWAYGYTERLEGRGNNCEVSGMPFDSVPVNFLNVESCLPARNRRPLLYNPELTNFQRTQRDTLMCQCFAQGQSLEERVAPEQPQMEELRQKNVFHQRNASSHRARQTEQDFGNGYGAAVTTMNFAGNSEEALRMAGVYSLDGQPSQESVSALRDIVEPRELSSNFCVPPREFILHTQFPNDEKFYEDLNRNFEPDEWDYGKIQERLRQYSSLDEIQRNSEASRDLVRMGFLIRNPAFRAVFMTNNNNARRLHQILRSHFPRPTCADIGCVRGENWSRMLPTYQREVRDFLRDTLGEVQANLAELKEVTAKAGPFSDDILDNPIEADYNAWRNFCDLRSTARAPNPQGNDLMLEIEGQYEVNYSNILNNPDYLRLNEVYCTEARVDRRTSPPSSATFGPWSAQNCSGVPQRECLARFVQAYPGTSELGLDWNYNINEILENSNIIAQVERGATETITRIASSPVARSESIRYLREAPAGLTPQSPASAFTGRSPASSSSAQPSQTASSAATPQNIPENYFVPTLPPQVPEAQAESVRAIGREAQEAQERANSFREEFSSLRNQINERRQANPQDPRINELTGQINQLEAQLRRAEEAAADSRRRYDEALARVRSGGTSEGDDESDVPVRSTSSSRSPRASNAEASFSAPSSVQQPGQQPGPLLPLNLPSAGSGEAAGPSSAQSRSRSAGSSVNNALLSRSAVQDAGPQSGSAITVSSSQEFQSLSSRVTGAPITDEVPVELFRQLTSDEAVIARYGTRALAQGEITLVNVTSTGGNSSGQMQLLIVNEEGRPKVVRQEGSQVLPERAPASVRENRLEDLNRELRR